MSSSASSSTASTAPLLPLPSLAYHPAIQHLRQLHPQLDDEQLQAIAHEALHAPSPSTTDTVFPPLSVVACPGSGKTLTLAARIAFFISYHRIPAHHILAITFTRKAKAELVERVAGIIKHEQTAARTAGRPPPSSDGLVVRTFSSLALHYIRKYTIKFGWHSSMRVLQNDKDMKRVIKEIVEEAQAAAQHKMPAAEATHYKMKHEAEQEAAAAGEEDKESGRWDDDFDDDEAVRLLNDVESQQPTKPTAHHQPPPPAALPKLTAALYNKPFANSRHQERFVNNAFDYINSIRQRAGLTLKPPTAHSAATLQTAPHHRMAHTKPLSDEDAELMHELLLAFDARLHATAQLSQGDFIPAFLALLRADEAVLREVRSEWQAVFVDEVQDSSRSDIALLLAIVGCDRWIEVEKSAQDRVPKPLPVRPAGHLRGLTSHLSLVGDPQQCIYGFRSVDPLALDAVSSVLDACGLVRLRLSSNYRSTQNIVATAVGYHRIQRDEAS